MSTLERQLTSDIAVVASSAEYRKVLSGGYSARLEAAVRNIAEALHAPDSSTRLDVLRRVWQWRVANRSDDATLRTLVFNSAGEEAGFDAGALALELRVGSSILDCAMLGPGAEEAVEIKSGLDSMSRLTDQVRNYRAAFPRVTLLGDEASAPRLRREAARLGTGLVVAVRRRNSWKLLVEREAAESWATVELPHVLGMLRTGEIAEIARTVAGPNFEPKPVRLFREALTALEDEDVADVARAAYAAIRARRRLTTRSLARDVPLPIRATIAAINPFPEQLSDLRDWLSAEV